MITPPKLRKLALLTAGVLASCAVAVGTATPASASDFSAGAKSRFLAACGPVTCGFASNDAKISAAYGWCAAYDVRKNVRHEPDAWNASIRQVNLVGTAGGSWAKADNIARAAHAYICPRY